jgi:hypothetical protein
MTVAVIPWLSRSRGLNPLHFSLRGLLEEYRLCVCYFKQHQSNEDSDYTSHTESGRDIRNSIWTELDYRWNTDYVTEETVCSLVYVSHACLQYN